MGKVIHRKKEDVLDWFHERLPYLKEASFVSPIGAGKYDDDYVYSFSYKWYHFSINVSFWQPGVWVDGGSTHDLSKNQQVHLCFFLQNADHEGAYASNYIEFYRKKCGSANIYKFTEELAKTVDQQMDKLIESRNIIEYYERMKHV
jgi:hypothetical protein